MGVGFRGGWGGVPLVFVVVVLLVVLVAMFVFVVVVGCVLLV